MNCYSYDPSTGEFAGIEAMRESPLEVGVFLLPACATLTEPPTAREKEVAVFRNESWAILPDHREEVWWIRHGQNITISEIGVEPDPAWTADEPPISARESVLAQIVALEAQQTPRRIREAALTDEGRAWLEALDAQIAALRAQLGA